MRTLPLKVLIADDHEIVRGGVRSILAEHAKLVAVVGEVANGKDAVDEAGILVPDLIIMDWQMPALEGLNAAQIIKKRNPEIAILMFSMNASRQYIELARGLGLDGFIAKEKAATELILAIDAVMRHQKYFPA
jgi:two-component system, NarL family, nitrate/nitrite response regulator NarL